MEPCVRQTAETGQFVHHTFQNGSSECLIYVKIQGDFLVYHWGTMIHGIVKHQTSMVHLSPIRKIFVEEQIPQKV